MFDPYSGDQPESSECGSSYKSGDNSVTIRVKLQGIRNKMELLEPAGHFYRQYVQGENENTLLHFARKFSNGGGWFPPGIGHCDCIFFGILSVQMGNIRLNFLLFGFILGKLLSIFFQLLLRFFYPKFNCPQFP